MSTLKLFMLLLGCRPKGRLTEQHDVFFGVAGSLKELVPQLRRFWPEAGGGLHIDAWREVTRVEGYSIRVVNKETLEKKAERLFFLNLGGYKPGEFEEYHYRLLTIAPDLATAIKAGKRSLFFKHTSFTGAAAHIDDKYGLDVDDAHEVSELLDPAFKGQYALEISPAQQADDALHLGYLPLWKIRD